VTTKSSGRSVKWRWTGTAQFVIGRTVACCVECVLDRLISLPGAELASTCCRLEISKVWVRSLDFIFKVVFCVPPDSGECTKMKTTTRLHVRDSVRQIDCNAWLVGDQFIIRRQRPAPAEFLWEDSDGFWYTLSDAVPPLPPSTPLPADSHIRQVHDAGDASAVWSFGDAFLKIKLTPPDFRNTTKEHTTLEWLARHREQLSFAVPRVLHHAETDDRSYLLITRVPGQVLADAWRTLHEDDKRHYVRRIVDICRELSVWQSSAMTGVDGGEFPETWLDLCRPSYSFKPHDLQKTCAGLGMDCSTFYLWHSDLGPHNILINAGEPGAVGIIDWEIAGFVPLAWVRTKFSVSWGLDFAWPEVHGDDPSLREWRERVERQFGDEGYPEVKAAWKQWFMERVSSRRSQS
jgi:hypothetical protein